MTFILNFAIVTTTEVMMVRNIEKGHQTKWFEWWLNMIFIICIVYHVACIVLYHIVGRFTSCLSNIHLIEFGRSSNFSHVILFIDHPFVNWNRKLNHTKLPVLLRQTILVTNLHETVVIQSYTMRGVLRTSIIIYNTQKKLYSPFRQEKETKKWSS